VTTDFLLEMASDDNGLLLLCLSIY